MLFVILSSIDAQTVRYTAHGKYYAGYKKPVNSSHKLESSASVAEGIIFIHGDLSHALDGYHMLVTAVGVVKVQIVSVIHFIPLSVD